MEAGLQQLYVLLGEGLIILIIGWVGASVRGIYRELRTQNGRLRTLEERIKGHIELDDVRINDIRELLKEIISSLREVRIAEK